MLQIRNAIKSDMNQLSKLIKEHASDLNMMSEATLTPEYLTEHGFNRSPPSFKCTIVYIKSNGTEKMIGYMIFFDIYSTWVGKTMMVDDMYIRHEHVDDKYLMGLMHLIMLDAKENGYNRLEFGITAGDVLVNHHLARGATDLGDSDLKVKFHYQGQDRVETEKWLSYRIEKDVMKAMAAECRNVVK